MNIKCPNCNADVEIPIDAQKPIRISCGKCQELITAEMCLIQGFKKQQDVRKFLVGEKVYVVLKGHEFNMEPAAVVQSDYAFCRVSVKRGKQEILIWVPETWLQKGF